MSTVPATRATLDDLYREEGKAELIGGNIKRFMASGQRPGRVAGRIYVRLFSHEETTRVGKAYADGHGFAVPELTSGRESFSPGAAYDFGPDPANDVRFVEHAPTFAVEVRSENDYGPTADREYEEKRADYFEAGTLAVWDVDPRAATITLHRPGQPPLIFNRGDVAHAEPAVPGWQMSVDDAFNV